MVFEWPGHVLPKKQPWWAVLLYIVGIAALIVFSIINPLAGLVLDFLFLGLSLMTYILNPTPENLAWLIVDIALLVLPAIIAFIRVLKSARPAVRAIDGMSDVADAARLAGVDDGLGALDWDSIVSATGETRYEHVMKHSTANPNKATHSVFSGNPITTTNQAWSMRAGITPILDRGLSVYNIPFANAGILGENAVRIVVKPNTSILVSAYPVFIV